MAVFINWTLKDKIKYHRRRYIEYIDSITDAKSVKKNYTPKVQYSTMFLNGAYGHRVNENKMTWSERMGYWRGQRARVKDKYNR